MDTGCTTSGCLSVETRLCGTGHTRLRPPGSCTCLVGTLGSEHVPHWARACRAGTFRKKPGHACSETGPVGTECTRQNRCFPGTSLWDSFGTRDPARQSQSYIGLLHTPGRRRHGQTPYVCCTGLADTVCTKTGRILPRSRCCICPEGNYCRQWIRPPGDPPKRSQRGSQSKHRQRELAPFRSQTGPLGTLCTRWLQGSPHFERGNRSGRFCTDTAVLGPSRSLSDKPSN